MPNPNPSQDTVTITVTYSGMNAPHVMTPVTRLSGETDEELSERAVGYATTYGRVNQFGKVASVTGVWS